MGIGCGVGYEGDIFLVEGIVAVVTKILGNILTPLVQIVEIQQIALVNDKIGRIPENDVPHVIIGNLVGNRADEIWLAQGDVKVHTGFALHAVGSDVVSDHIVHVATVDQGRSQLLGAGLGQGIIIDHRRSAHTLNPAVDPLGAVLARQVIER